MATQVLFVDDEQNLLDGFKRQFRNKYQFQTAVSGVEGLKLLSESSDFAVVVSDMRMPEMGGIEFLSEVKRIAPDAVRLMLTGNADQETAIRAVNETGIFRFLLKPCSFTDLSKAISDALEQHQLIISERELLEKTVLGTVNLLSELLVQSNTEAENDRAEVLDTIGILCKAGSIESKWAVEIAATLFEIGSITLPTEVAKRIRLGAPADANEQMFLDSLPQLSSDLLAMIPRLEPVSAIIKHTNSLDISNAPTGAKILRIAREFSKLLRKFPDRKAAYLELERNRHLFDSLLLFKLRESIFSGSEPVVSTAESFKISVEELIAGQCLLADILTLDGRLLLLKGRVLTDLQVSRIKNHHRLAGVQTPIEVDCRVPTL